IETPRALFVLSVAVIDARGVARAHDRKNCINCCAQSCHILWRGDHNNVCSAFVYELQKSRARMSAALFQLICAPCSIHLASRSRSSWVICVMLPSGMIWLAIVCAWILAAICWICSGVSNITPAGAALNSGLVGLAEWHTVQRSSITLLTLLNWLWLSALFSCSLMLACSGVVGSRFCGTGWRFGDSTKARQIMPTAAAGSAQA